MAFAPSPGQDAGRKDQFTRHRTFRPDIVVDIDDVYHKKLDMLDGTSFSSTNGSLA